MSDEDVSYADSFMSIHQYAKKYKLDPLLQTTISRYNNYIEKRIDDMYESGSDSDEDWEPESVTMSDQ
jgi:hypothetical protein